MSSTSSLGAQQMRSCLLLAIVVQAMLVSGAAAFITSLPRADLGLGMRCRCFHSRGVRETHVTTSASSTDSDVRLDGDMGRDSDQYAMRKRQISVMVHQLARIGADLEALGPDGDCVAVIDELSARLDSLNQQLAAAKESSIQSQMQSFNLNALVQARKVKLHLGCGRNTLAGWLNADLHGWRLNTGGGRDANRAKERVLSINVGTTPLPLPDGSCELVYTSHMLEHLIHPAQTRLVMEEVHRVLAPGGTVRIVVPDAAVWLKGYVQEDVRFFDVVRKEWQHWNWAALDSLNGSSLDYILPYLGASSIQGHLAGDHQFGFDEASMRALLVSAGFEEDAVRRSSYQKSCVEDLRVDEASEAAGVKLLLDNGETYLSLFMEATKSTTPTPSSSATLPAPSSARPPSGSAGEAPKGSRLRRALQQIVKRLL